MADNQEIIKLQENLTDLVKQGLVEPICECGKVIDLNKIKYRLTKSGTELAEKIIKNG